MAGVGAGKSGVVRVADGFRPNRMDENWGGSKERWDECCDAPAPFCGTLSRFCIPKRLAYP